ncbi:GlxA family transcriptional regulator [Duganella aceris]|uniref:Helix-turn-helix domain-containing protein n=1 Tax=Duganella aceris TaxID=2703883 RepID=A0ABX0FKS4_9BURK|nr:helix-turn-helix domain-containing protein [Duganella aceris]NGZ85196.1 helix-turn-helix domain-containing protein [Duganella aceris]
MKSKKRVVILGLPPVDALDVIGPAEVFAYANRLSQTAAQPYQVELVSAGAELYLESETGIELRGHRTLAQERESGKPIDTLIVATGFAAINRLNPEAVAWIRKRARHIRRICSICVGAFVLAETGLLDGRKATTHWGMARQLADAYPLIRVDPAPIWVKDGNLYTSAGISAGIDLALSLVSEDLGDEAALAVAKNLVLFLRRPGGQAQFSVSLQSQQTPSSSLDALCLWISEHLESDLTVEILADHMATSVRTLIRTFQRELNTTPAKYVEDVRLEAVSRALEFGGQSLEEIARRCGYNSVDVLRKAFVRRIGLSPKDYVQRFAPGSGES